MRNVCPGKRTGYSPCSQLGQWLNRPVLGPKPTQGRCHACNAWGTQHSQHEHSMPCHLVPNKDETVPEDTHQFKTIQNPHHPAHTTRLPIGRNEYTYYQMSFSHKCIHLCITARDTQIQYFEGKQIPAKGSTRMTWMVCTVCMAMSLPHVTGHYCIRTIPHVNYGT